MGADPRQAEVALRAYLERGRIALEQLEKGQWDDAQVVLKWREAAFNEFRSVELVAGAEDFQQGSRSSLRELRLEVDEQNRELESALTEALVRLGGMLGKTIEKRQKLGKFHSGVGRNLGY